ncbi:carboxypeptidase regulatory-like domain-containing protein [Bacteroidota bacterium]
MKTKFLLLLLGSVFYFFPLFSQSSFGTISGQIFDSATNKPIEFANVVIMQAGNQVTGTMTDDKGFYSLSPLKPGTYELGASYMGYKQYRQVGVIINGGRITKMDIVLAPGNVILDPIEILTYTIPIIPIDEGSGKTYSPVEIKNAPIEGITDLVNFTPGVVDGSIQGQRSEGTVYIVDGIKIRGNLTVPMNSIQEMRVITGALPAEYGDVLGGVILIETINPLNRYVPREYDNSRKDRKKKRGNSSPADEEKIQPVG